MRFKRRIWLCYIQFFTFILKQKKWQKTKHFNCSAQKVTTSQQIDIITVAFNNEHFIEYQIKLIKKYIQDPHVTFIVADNSSQPEKRKLISDLCRQYHVGYISVPWNLIQQLPGGSYAHGTTLNWLYHNVVKVRQPYLFGFLDHDLFPTMPISIIEKLGKNDFYGRVIEREKGWWLWAGLCFFKFDRVKNLPLNFIPYIEQGVYLDTGGANYPILYKKYDLNTLHLPVAQNIQISEGSEYHSDYIQLIEECWLHMINGSNWKGISNQAQQNKNKIIHEKLLRIFEA